jgi:hypothetical protein
MNRQLTPRVMILAASIAGLIACDNAPKQVDRTQQDLSEHRQEAAKEQAELRREHEKERVDLQREAQRERANDPVVVPPADTRAEVREENAREERAEINRETTDLKKEHAKERADLNQEQAKDRKDLHEDLNEAKKDAERERAEIVKDSREKLQELDQRAAEVRARVEQGRAEDARQANSALSAFPGQRKAVERDIDALNTVTAANLNRAKGNVEKKLSSLDKTLDRAEAHD